MTYELPKCSNCGEPVVKVRWQSENPKFRSPLIPVLCHLDAELKDGVDWTHGHGSSFCEDAGHEPGMARFEEDDSWESPFTDIQRKVGIVEEDDSLGEEDDPLEE